MSFILDTEKDTERWKNLPCSCTGGINTAEITILSKQINKSNETIIKTPNDILHVNRKDPKIHMEMQKTKQSQAKRNNARRNCHSRVQDIL